MNTPDIQPPLDQCIPDEIIGLGKDSILLIYEDGTQKNYPAKMLREQCGCAFCIDELTGQKKYSAPKEALSPLLITHIEILGRYALQIQFSDGHKTGIFHLRKLYNGLLPITS